MSHDLVEVPPLVADLHLHLFHVHHETPEKGRTVSGFHVGPGPSFGAATAVSPEAYQKGRLTWRAVRRDSRFFPSAPQKPRRGAPFVVRREVNLHGCA